MFWPWIWSTLHALSKYVFCFCGVHCSINVNGDKWMILLFYTFLSLLVLSTYSFNYGEGSVKIFIYNYHFVYFFFLLLVFVSLLWITVVKCIYIWNCYGFMENWPLYHYVISSYIPYNNSYFIAYNYLNYIWLMFAQDIFSIHYY